MTKNSIVAHLKIHQKQIGVDLLRESFKIQFFNKNANFQKSHLPCSKLPYPVRFQYQYIRLLFRIQIESYQSANDYVWNNFAVPPLKMIV